ncbi:hypothetical protein DPMN_059709 [Dreissena polymorpha]|uniref:C-type lectin domain-containing protein n=1 Tax=Dreissena polymorpha TaxID=45954 RepID=A0A9D4HGX2_DREPO|nr:hypothetical protein DPMN_059709 [Dreissena polymorpha]
MSQRLGEIRELLLLFWTHGLQLSGFADQRHWIGLSDENHEGNWTWYPSEKRAEYTDWDRHQPNNGTVSNCGAIVASHNYHWVDEPCSRQFMPVCELIDDQLIIVG